jgi:hypothetical protein
MYVNVLTGERKWICTRWAVEGEVPDIDERCVPERIESEVVAVSTEAQLPDTAPIDAAPIDAGVGEAGVALLQGVAEMQDTTHVASEGRGILDEIRKLEVILARSERAYALERLARIVASY